MFKNAKLGWVAVAGLAVCVPAYAGGAGAKDIVDTAVAAGKFNTLVTAVKAAGLVEALKGDGPLTVFAPTDEAFAKLPPGTVESLLAEPEKLKAILLYHVAAGKLTSAEVVKTPRIKTLLGQTAPISTDGKAMIGSATIVTTDVEASNGVIHIIDTVLIPKNDIIEVARSAGQFKTLLTALDAAGLTDALRADGPFTVFAPTDEAFAKLPAGTLEALLQDKARLTSILTYHVVPGRVMSSQAAKLTEAKTLQGGLLKIDATSGVKINDAQVVKADVEATNGVVHVIDAVVIPE